MKSSIDITNKKYRAYLKNNSWTLCLGAGICNGILPNWFELTRRVVNKTFNYNYNSVEFKKIIDDIPFSLDSWLQVSLNYIQSNGKSVDDFYTILEEELFHDLLKEASAQNLEKQMRIFLNNPKRLVKEELLNLCTFFETKYPDSTLLQLKNVLLDKDNRIFRPQQIVTFNADSLLSSLLVIYSVRESYYTKDDYNFHYEEYIRVTRPFQNGFTKIPIYHLHGAIFPRQFNSHISKSDARDNLVFAEASYTKIAGSMLSWAQNMFLHFSLNTKMIFVGLSMSDPNIRRWLSWSTDNINAQLEVYKGKKEDFAKHLWINRKPIDKKIEALLETSLKHLSIKPGWVDDWKDLQTGLLNIMGKK